MKNKFKFTTALLMSGILGFSACTDSFKDFNATNGAYTDELQKYDNQTNLVPFATIQKGIIYQTGIEGTDWQYQVMQNLAADMYSGYFHDMNGSFNDKNSTYKLNDGWTSAMWTTTYSQCMPIILNSEELNTEKEFPLFNALTKILKVTTMHRVSDYYGPILYRNFGKTNAAPESQEQVYKNFFEDLASAVTLLKNYKGAETFAESDIMMPEGKRTHTQWLKFANSLRLRLAMRISNVNPTLAAQEAKAALDPDNGGVLEKANETVGQYGIRNPLGGVSAWSEVYMNASMESFITGYKDPRLEAYYVKAVGGSNEAQGNIPELSPIAGKFKGVRQGSGVPDNRYINHSATSITIGHKIIIMTAAEVWFLRAEAALRGYVTDKTAKECYEEGVKTSFSQWGTAGVDDYLQSNATPSKYVDAFNAAFDAEPTTTITPKWDEAATNEQKLERIITQKWLAIYPEGCEAWAEQRRTGYPKLFKVVVNNSDKVAGQKIDTDIMIRRIFFPQSYKTDNATLYNALVSALGGADNGGTRLWWDAGKNNF
ncbi:MAG: SusD/RagB family nutrient-binding outer membrane lipoprotein [Bacteroides sp.]